MARPSLKAMVLSAVLASAHAALFTLPMVTQVIEHVCGASGLTQWEFSPCTRHILQLETVFSECAQLHNGDAEGFPRCVQACDDHKECANVCRAHAGSPDDCMERCRSVSACADHAAGMERGVVTGHERGPVAAEGAMRRCLLTRTHVETKLSLIMDPPPGSLASAPAAAPVVQPAAEPAESSNAAAPAAGSAANSPDAATSSPCSCVPHGVIRDTVTGQPGCARHAREAGAGLEAYCYITGNVEQCGAQVKQSQSFPGLFWTSCYQPEFRRYLPANCELTRNNVAILPAIPPPLVMEEPPPTLDGMRVYGSSPAPAAGAAMEVRRYLFNSAAYSTTLSPEWHLERAGAFPRAVAAPAAVVVAAPAAVVAAAPAAAAAAHGDLHMKALRGWGEPPHGR